jgi:AAA+ ATPase superfamily predicted ATPase
MSSGKTSHEVFVGRRSELAVLEDAWRSRSSAFIPVYGRRRVGKSELILRFLRNKPAIYHVGKVAPAGPQLREFLEEAGRVLGDPVIASLPAESWRTSLQLVVDRWRRPGKLVIALDEFQWTAAASPELPSVLQELWDRTWRRHGRVVLIVCGSWIGFMERQVLGAKSPLYGRRTAQIHLRPFGHREAAEFHPRWSRIDQARAHFVCGGVPLYLQRLHPDRSIETNLALELFDEHAPLGHEPEFLLREELRGVEVYNAVLLALAAGHTSIKTIARSSGVPERNLNYSLQQLVELGYVARRHPLTGARPAARHVRYRLDDPLLRFWFRFVFPHRSYIQRAGPERAFQELVAPELDSYCGTGFERLCREALPRLYEREKVIGPYEIGEYWDKTTQIDVVGLRNDGVTDLGEAKWGPVSPKAAVAELEAKVAAFPNRRGATVCRRVFVRSLPRKPSPAARWHDLDDLYR